MYESIRGSLQEKSPTQAIVECGGLGYRLTIPLSTYSQLPACGQEVVFYLSLIVREDAHTLYAFLAKEERNLFETLITISGIGPKTAAAIIGHMDLSSFQRAITTADVRLLSKMPGIGKKTAERLVIEMRDKLQGKAKAFLPPLSGGKSNSVHDDAINALINLGYNAMDAHKAIQNVLSVQPDEKDLSQIITAALRQAR